MSEIKYVVMAQILKYENRPFKASQIAHETGLTRSHVNYYLDKLRDEGAILKQGPLFILEDKARLINSLAVPTFTTKTPVKPTLLFPDNKTDSLKTFIKIILQARALDLEFAVDVRKALIEEIDATILMFKTARKNLSEGSIGTHSARRAIEESIDEWTGEYTDLLDLFGMSRKKLRQDLAVELSKMFSEF